MDTLSNCGAQQVLNFLRGSNSEDPRAFDKKSQDPHKIATKKKWSPTSICLKPPSENRVPSKPKQRKINPNPHLPPLPEAAKLPIRKSPTRGNKTTHFRLVLLQVPPLRVPVKWYAVGTPANGRLGDPNPIGREGVCFAVATEHFKVYFEYLKPIDSLSARSKPLRIRSDESQYVTIKTRY